MEAWCLILVSFPLFSSTAALEVARLEVPRRTPNLSFWLRCSSPLAGASGLTASLQSSVYFLSAVREFHPALSHWRSWKVGGGEGGELVSEQFWPHTMKSFLPARRNSHQENLQLFSPLFFKVGFTDCEEWSNFFSVIICSSIAPSSWDLQSTLFVLMQSSPPSCELGQCFFILLVESVSQQQSLESVFLHRGA